MKKTIFIGLIFVAIVSTGCACSSSNDQNPTASSGVTKAQAKVTVGADGLTIEQKNVLERLAEDNKLGSVKHLYVISAYSGQVIIYSTVRGKVTSSGKRLTPTTTTGEGEYNHSGTAFVINGKSYDTAEVLQDDGTYGHSGDYLFWWDTKGVYHQHYIAGGQIVHVSNQPLAVKSVIINMTATK